MRDKPFDKSYFLNFFSYNKISCIDLIRELIKVLTELAGGVNSSSGDGR